MKITDELIGKRFIFREFPYSTIQEGVIEEISPSKKYVKINGSWYPTDNISVIEVLGDAEEDNALNVLKRYKYRYLR